MTGRDVRGIECGKASAGLTERWDFRAFDPGILIPPSPPPAFYSMTLPDNIPGFCPTMPAFQGTLVIERASSAQCFPRFSAPFLICAFGSYGCHRTGVGWGRRVMLR